MKRELRRLPHGAQEDEERGHVQGPLADGPLFGDVEDRGDVEGAGGLEQEDDSDQQPDVADSRGDECLLGGLRRRPSLVPEADQQV